MSRITFRAFTLAELLIALAILGVIATFTIPKVLSAQNSSKYKAIAKEAAGTVSGAYQQLILNSGTNSGVKFDNITPYINYVKVDASATTIDLFYGASSRACNIGYTCLKLHNGAMLLYSDASFGGTAANNGIYFYIDPDGAETDSTTNGPGKSVVFFLYYDGKIRSADNAVNSTTDSSGNVYNPGGGWDPPWFSWN